uniref:Ras-GEF domain-containing protein n=1 Tax=Equus caballus TaxID=9796 RepID=A0A9L0SUI9_HORSE
CRGSQSLCCQPSPAESSAVSSPPSTATQAPALPTRSWTSCFPEPAPKLLPLPEPEPVPAPGLEPAAPPVSPRVVELEPAAPESATPGPEQGPPVKAAPEPSCPWAVTTEDQLREEKPNILDFPPQLVAEQMTRMAAELFKTLVPAHCLGSIWSECDNRERESLAPTVRDTVMHYNTVANCILVTCLGDASMTAQDRARVVELWIRVAENRRSP